MAPGHVTARIPNLHVQRGVYVGVFWQHTDLAKLIREAAFGQHGSVSVEGVGLTALARPCHGQESSKLPGRLHNEGEAGNDTSAGIAQRGSHQDGRERTLWRSLRIPQDGRAHHGSALPDGTHDLVGGAGQPADRPIPVSGDLHAVQAQYAVAAVTVGLCHAPQERANLAQCGRRQQGLPRCVGLRRHIQQLED